MHKAQKQVEELCRAFGHTVGESTEIRAAELRAALGIEEAIETVVALLGSVRAMEVVRAAMEKIDTLTPTQPDRIAAIDGVCDSLVVNYGTAVAMGFDVEPFFDEVHRSNMAKIGGPVREDGKRLKPPGWTPPDIAGVLARLTAECTSVPSLSAPQPPPAPEDPAKPALWDLVIGDTMAAGPSGDAICALLVADMRDRDAAGRAKYRVPLQAHNRRDALVDAFQESLDLCVYLKQACVEGQDLQDDYQFALDGAMSLRVAIFERDAK